MRLFLTTDKPLDIYQLMTCAASDIDDRLGSTEARLRIKGVQDTIYKTRGDSIAVGRASQKIRGGVVTTNCDSASVANRKHRADSIAQHSQ